MKIIYAFITLGICFSSFALFTSCNKGQIPSDHSVTESFSDYSAENSYNETQDDSSEDNVADINESIFSFSETANGLTITGLMQEVPDLLVPATIGGLPVIEIAETAFADRRELQNVSIADGVKHIGERAFKNCSSLKTISLPESVEFIGYAAFNGCSAITEISLPFTGEREKIGVALKSYPFGYIFGEEKYSGGAQTVQYYYDTSLEFVESAAYYIPKSLKTVSVTGKGETHIPYDAFRNCENLKKITLGNKIASVGRFAFSCCDAEIVWDNPKIEKIDEYAYADYKGKNLSIPATVKSIGKCAFEDCENLKEISVPDGVCDIDIFAFRGCTALTKAVLGNGVKKLGVNAFYFCTALKDVTLPENIEEISDSAFMSCKSLERINLTKNLKIIGKDAFKNCRKLKSVTFEETRGWRYYNSTTSGEELAQSSAANPSTVAYYLTDRYSDYIWERISD